MESTSFKCTLSDSLAFQFPMIVCLCSYIGFQQFPRNYQVPVFHVLIEETGRVHHHFSRDLLLEEKTLYDIFFTMEVIQIQMETCTKTVVEHYQVACNIDSRVVLPCILLSTATL